MPAPRKFDEEPRARAVRLYQDRLRDHGESKLAARRHVGQLLDINPATRRNWIEADERAARPASSNSTSSVEDEAELRRLRQEVAELRRANEILTDFGTYSARSWAKGCSLRSRPNRRGAGRAGTGARAACPSSPETRDHGAPQRHPPGNKFGR